MGRHTPERHPMNERPLKPRGYVSSYDHDAPTPPVGSEWMWEKRRWKWSEIPVFVPAVQRGINIRVTVEEVKWNGEEWWVKVSGYWNDLGRFWEAVS